MLGDNLELMEELELKIKEVFGLLVVIVGVFVGD